MDQTLEASRIKIDAIDKQIMALFEERMGVVVDVARYKEKHGLPIFQKEREEQVIAKNVDRLENKELERYAREMIQSLMDVSKAYQCSQLGLKEMPLGKESVAKIGFQGVPGSFSEEALIGYFGEAYERKCYKSFEDVFAAIKYNEVTYGILPIENSSTGSITQIYDLLKKYGFYIVGETTIAIKQHLLGHPGAKIKEIKEIYSHQQGFEQSREYLKSLDDTICVPYHNTAISAQFVKESNDPHKAAIGSKRAGELYGLEVLKEAINDESKNYTRFIIISAERESNALSDKITLSFTLGNESGSLYEQLRVFSERGINMMKIESRPVGNGCFNYFFYVDIDGNILDEHVKEALEQIAKGVEAYRLLGCYKKSSV